ncbi:MAG TPA: putative baseplate assembly protein [Trebonia sp.]|nr:putative baseplate assembly protein [Trebonia sp.]
MTGQAGCAGCGQNEPGCGCQAGRPPQTPARISNPPGQPVIGYRAGDYGAFFSSMLARLGSSAYPALASLTVRDPSDPAIALIDGWAAVADLLTFYTERLANEGYLRTATEPASLRLLGMLAGYRPRPGVAASTYLSFTVDASSPGTTVTIPGGTRALSIPAPGQGAQAFESAADLPGRSSWNDLAVRTRRPVQVSLAGLPALTQVTLAAGGTPLSPGSRLLFLFGAEPGQQRLWVVSTVAVDQAARVTVVGQAPPALPTLDQMKAEYEALLIDPAIDLPGMDARSRIVSRLADDWLAPLAGQLTEVTTQEDLAARLDAVLRGLEDAAALAERYPAIHTWLTGTLRPALASLRAEVARPFRAHRPGVLGSGLPGRGGVGSGGLGPDVLGPGVPGPDAGTGDQQGQEQPTDPALLALGAVLPALRRPPGTPPASAAALATDPAQLFAPGSAAGPQLLTALDPRLEPTLYQAWRQTDITAPPELREVQALRVTASPFGATAPRQAAYDAQGQVAGRAEWPLAAEQLLDTRVSFDDDWRARGAAFTLTSDDGSWSLSVELADGQQADFALGPGQVRITPTAPPPPEWRLFGRRAPAATTPPTPGTTFTFTGAIPNGTVFVSDGQPDGGIRVSVDDGTSPQATFRLNVGDALTGQQGHSQVRAGRHGGARNAQPAVDVLLRAALSPADKRLLTLDGIYDGIAPGSWVAVERPRKGLAGQGGIPGGKGLSLVISRVTSARAISVADFGITGKVTQLSLEQPWLDEHDTLLAHIRDATVYARGEPLQLATEQVADDVGGDKIELAQAHDGLQPGRWLVVTGERTDIPGTAGVQGSELSMIGSVRQQVDPALPGDTVHSTLTLASPLGYTYRRSTVRVAANVVAATQGATVDEVLGSGDASQAGQSFTLFQAPVTWVPAANSAGAASTLRISVNGAPWHEVDTFAGRGPAERVYVTAIGDDGHVRVTFGNGINGARLPAGTENIRARYRVGVGAAANIPGGQVGQLTARPLGVAGVGNPLPATGGADPDGPAEARRDIPIAVCALDRLVSVRDYEDFTRRRAGIDKASARRLFDGAREVVHVTAAGTSDAPLEPASGVLPALAASLVKLGDPQLPVQVAAREAVLLVIAARVRLTTGYRWDIVQAVVRAALASRFSFAARQLGQPAYRSEVLATISAVPGVDYADVDVFTGVPDSVTPAGLQGLAGTLSGPREVVRARLASYDETRYLVPAGHRSGQTLSQVAAANGISVADLLELNPWITGATLAPGTSVFVFRGIRPAQLVMLSAAAPDTLVLEEITT